MIRQIIVALCMGIAASLFFLQNDPYIKRVILHSCQSIFETALDCSVEADDLSFHVFVPEIRLVNMRVRPRDKADTSWYWTCADYRTGFSWLYFFRYGIVNMYIDMTQSFFYSSVRDKKISLMPHIERLCAKTETTIPFYTDRLMLRSAQLSVAGEDSQLNISAVWDSISKRIDNQLRSKIHVSNGSIRSLCPVTFEDITGSVIFTIAQGVEGPEFEIYPDVSCTVPEWEKGGRCSLGGSWLSNHGRFFLRNSERSSVFDPIIITQQEQEWHIKMQGYAPADYCACLLSAYNIPRPTEGTCTLAMTAHCKDTVWEVDGHCAVERIMFPSVESYMTGKSLFLKRGDAWTLAGNIRSAYGDASLRGEWDCIKNEGKVRCTNQSDVIHPFCKQWVIRSGKASLDLAMTAGGLARGDYTVVATELRSRVDYALSGLIALEDISKFKVSGECQGYCFSSAGVATTWPFMHSLSVQTTKDKPVFSLQKNSFDCDHFSGVFHLDQGRIILNLLTGYSCQAEGEVSYTVAFEDKNVDLCFALKNGGIRLGNTHNFLTDFSTRCRANIFDRTCRFSGIKMQLYEGRIDCPSLVIRYPDKNHFFIHAPLLFDRCHINQEADFFAITSGALVVSYPLISGMVIIHNALLKENIFSNDVCKQMQRASFSIDKPLIPPFSLSIDVITRDPVVVDTPFLKTEAHISVRAENTTQDPFFNGSILLKGGVLQFPYHPLFIQSGHVLFSSGHNDDPLVSLLARNTLKNHEVTLQASGSLHDHHITLLSTPFLTEEQIMSLLVAGSQESLLNMMIPALIVQNLPHLIFGSRHSAFIDKYFRPLITPLTINLIPSFADQTGRGGIRGGVEITVNDRIRALIQKNFNLTEDTRFELEYLVSDDITVRAIRDERRDLGAELEVKWKF